MLAIKYGPLLLNPTLAGFRAPHSADLPSIYQPISLRTSKFSRRYKFIYSLFSYLLECHYQNQVVHKVMGPDLDLWLKMR